MINRIGRRGHHSGIEGSAEHMARAGEFIRMGGKESGIIPPTAGFQRKDNPRGIIINGEKTDEKNGRSVDRPLAAFSKIRQLQWYVQGYAISN